MNFNNKSLFKQLYNQSYKKNPPKLYDYAKDNLNFVQRLGLIKTLPLHQGCVNTLCWNESGSLLLSGSDDQHLIVTNGHTYNICHNYRTSHRANIFSAKFMPVSGDRNIVSCSGDGIVLYTDLERPSETYYSQFNCHSGTSYEVITIPNDPNTFFSCGEDGTVRWFDLRLKNRCKKARCKDDILILHHRAVTALSINPLTPHELAIGSSDSTVRIFDRRMLGTLATGYTKSPVYEPLSSFTVPELEERPYRITSLSYSPDGQEMLVSYSSDHLYLFRVRDQTEREVIVTGKSGAKSNWCKLKTATKRARRSPPPVRRLRLRGDWSDTGPDARPERDASSTVSIGQARPQLQATLMERMTNVLFRMLNDPLTRAALSAGGEDSLETNSSSTHSQENAQEGSHHHEEAAEQHDASTEDRSENMNEESFEIEADVQENISSSLTQQSTSSEQSHNSSIQDHAPAAESASKPSCSASDKTATEESELNNLQNKLSTLRHGFIKKHGSEPSVSLRYSDQSSSSSTIRLGVGDELNRSNYNVNQDHDPDISAPTEKHFNPAQNEAGSSYCFDNKQSSSQEAPHLRSSNSRLGLGVQVNPNFGLNQDLSQDNSLDAAATFQYNGTEAESAFHSDNKQNSSQGIAQDSSLNSDMNKNELDCGNISSNSNSNQQNSQVEMVASTSCDNTTSNRAVSTENEMDFSSNDELLAEATARGSADRSGSDIELDYSDSDEENREMMKGIGGEQYEHVVGIEKDGFVPHVRQKYVGHRNARTMIKEATFWGNDYVMSGSDCGHVFMWDRASAKLVMLLQADHHVVNCLQPHPTLPILATSGIDHDVKLWSPILEDVNFDMKMAEDLMKRNEVMLEETRDTITVPAAFMIRMLACLNQIRRTGTLSRSRRREDPDPDV